MGVNQTLRWLIHNTDKYWKCCTAKTNIIFLKNCCSILQSCLTLCDPMECNTPGFPVFQHLPEFIQTHVHWVGDAIQLSRPLSSPSPPAFNLFQHQGLSQKVSSSHQWTKYWSFSISPSSEYSGLISFRINWFDLIAVQETFKSLLQHHCLKAQFFSTQLSL